MSLATLGISGPAISRLGIGGWQAGGTGDWGGGPNSDDDASIAAIRHAVERGVTWVDTAASYGLGHSEEVVSRALEPWRIGEEVLVFTKCGHPWDPPLGIRTELKPSTIRRECEGSLSRLGVERIDLYQFHHPDPKTPIEDSWSLMADLVREGKVRCAGLSNTNAELVARCEPILHVESAQQELNLLRRTEIDALPSFVANGTGVIAYSPLATGMLSRAYDPERIAALSADDPHRTEGDEIAATLAALERVASSRGVSIAAVAVAWVLAQSGVTGTICGARSPEQVEGWIDAADLDLDEPALAELADGLGSG
jgi:aryl-alcohol dehydrogenase-like predicted oxidoreductase